MRRLFLWPLVAFLLLFLPKSSEGQNGSPSAYSRNLVAVAWNDFGTGAGMVRAVDANAPWNFRSEPLVVGLDPVLRAANRRLFVVSTQDSTITVVQPETWSVQRSYTLAPGSEPLDIAVVSPTTAYVTRRNSTHLLRLDLESGNTQEVLDLSLFANPGDGIPDLGTMSLHNGRLFVQVQRLSSEFPGFDPPAYLAVMDVATEELIDVDPALAGIQAIELAGTAPKLKMQVMERTNQLFVGATGAIFDEGGIEIVNLDTLRSEGLIVREADGLTGADLGPFVMVTSDRGYLSFTTDLTLSSHLHGFSQSAGVDSQQLAVAVDYMAPAIAYNPQAQNIFLPVGGGVENGILVFDAVTGERLTRNLLSTGGPPTDLQLVTLVPEPSGAKLWGSALLALALLRFAPWKAKRRGSRDLVQRKQPIPAGR